MRTDSYFAECAHKARRRLEYLDKASAWTGQVG